MVHQTKFAEDTLDQASEKFTKKASLLPYVETNNAGSAVATKTPSLGTYKS